MSWRLTLDLLTTSALVRISCFLITCLWIQVGGQGELLETKCQENDITLRCPAGQVVMVTDVRRVLDSLVTQCQSSYYCPKNNLLGHFIRTCHLSNQCQVPFDMAQCVAQAERNVETTVVYQCVSSQNVFNVCDLGDIEGMPFGFVHSPGFPQPYAPNQYCLGTVRFTGLSTVKINVLYYDLDALAASPVTLNYYQTRAGSPVATPFPIYGQGAGLVIAPLNASALAFEYQTGVATPKTGFLLLFSAEPVFPDSITTTSSSSTTTAATTTTTTGSSTETGNFGSPANASGDQLSVVVIAAVAVPAAVLLIALVVLAVVFARKKKKKNEKKYVGNHNIHFVGDTSSYAASMMNSPVNAVGEMSMARNNTGTAQRYRRELDRRQLSDTDQDSVSGSELEPAPVNPAQPRNVRWLGLGDGSD